MAGPVADFFGTQTTELTPSNAATIDSVKSDSVALAAVTKGFYIGDYGPNPTAVDGPGPGVDLRVTMVGGQIVTFENLPIGFFAIRATQIWATGTTATNSLVLW
jgi:hypothetical protein